MIDTDTDPLLYRLRACYRTALRTRPGPRRIQLRGVGLNLALGLVIAGCAVGPDFHAPAAPASNRVIAEEVPTRLSATDPQGTIVQTLTVGGTVPSRWWELFHNPDLNRLVEQSLAANPDLQAAQASLRAARETELAARGALFPTVGAQFDPSRQRNAVGTLSPTLTSGAPVFDLYTAQVSVGYVVDIFGGNRRALEAASALTDAQRYQALATYLTLTSNVVETAIQEASLRSQVQATEEIVRIEEDLLKLLQRQYELGQIGYADVAVQEAALAQARSSLFPLQKQLGQQRTLLAVLVGQEPSEEPDARFELTGLSVPADVPVSLPATIVRQRPDVQMAEAQMHAASAEVGVNLANMLPQITLSGNAGGASTGLGSLFTSGNRFWSVAADLAQPIFAGGSLYHREVAARAQFDQTRAQYRSVVLTALENVADTLHALMLDAPALTAAAESAAAAQRSLDIARKQVEWGAASGVALLNAEQTYQEARLSLAAAQANRLADTVALVQALGGGWSSPKSPVAQWAPDVR